MAELTIEQLDNALADDQPYMLVEVLHVEGSTPRDAGAMMLVGAEIVSGTIGGGSAEWMAINAAREMIATEMRSQTHSITLGPEIDQCCGGVIEVSYALLANNNYRHAVQSCQQGSLPKAYIYGAGHTGLAIANTLDMLGFELTIIDTRMDYESRVGTHKFDCLAIPEESVKNANKNAIFVVTTHDHSLDYLITATALQRGDAAYVGMIGSKSKRGVLKNWMKEADFPVTSFDQLYCPIGGSSVKNKQPEFIAVMCVAEILSALENRTHSS